MVRPCDRIKKMQQEGMTIMNFKQSYKMLNTSLALGLALCLLYRIADIRLAGGAGIIILIAGFLQTFLWYRCPYCGKPLKIKGSRPKTCEACNRELDWV